MNGSILYCGDSDLSGAASYLAGMMTSWGWSFEYVPSHQMISPELAKKPRSLLILSDYPATQFDADCQNLAVRQVEQGCGLLMIGGWESFHAFGGNWDGTPLGSILPVEIQVSDDRMNFDQSAWLAPRQDHPVTAGLPWATRPPAIGGMNRVVAKTEADVLLEAQSFAVSNVRLDGTKGSDSREWSFAAREAFPLLVAGQHGSGRTAAFMSDVAPHWVGGFVDWGIPRVSGQVPNGPMIEVGSDYARFWKQLLQWTGQRA